MAAVFDALTEEGGGGKGTLLFFSAANNNSDNDVVFDRPWGMYNKCFSVAASSLANDGATEVKALYSNFGSTTEFCAPSDGWGPVNHNHLISMEHLLQLQLLIQREMEQIEDLLLKQLYLPIPMLATILLPSIA
jgi:hypothetical protein